MTKDFKEIAELYFNEIDTDHNGTISNEEFCNYLQYKHLLNFPNQREILHDCFFFIDKDGNKEIDRDEFYHFIKCVYKQEGMNKRCDYPKLIFDILDRDESGEIDRDEIDRLNVYCKGDEASEESAKILFDNLDLNKDVRIQLSEFIRAFC